MGVNKLTYSIEIKAEKSRIWDALWVTYRDWANVFYEGSYAITDNWKEGSKVLFLAPDQSGIYSVIEKHTPNKIMKFKHIGNVLNGEEQALDDETKKWSGTTESYTLTEKSGINTLNIEIDVLDEHLDYMKEKLPIALDKIKSLSEEQ